MRLRSAVHGVPPLALRFFSVPALALLTVALVTLSGFAGSVGFPVHRSPSPFVHGQLSPLRASVPLGATPPLGCGADPCSAVGGHPSWTSLVGAPQPSARTGGVLAYDAADAFTLLFGGYEGYARPHHDLNDTWIERAGVWQLITPPVSPSPREEAAFATDPKTGCLLLFGGLNDSSHLALGDTWGFCGTSWYPINVATAPPPRFGAAMSTDPFCGCVLLFGGRVSPSGSVLGDTWQFASGHWTQPPAGSSPLPRFGAAMAWNSADQSVLLFGGSNGTAGATFNDSWSFSAGAWHPLALGVVPPSRMGFGLAALPGTGGVLLTGGASNGSYYNDTWQFTAGAWSQLPIVGAPPARSGLSLTYDGADNYPVLFGGLNASSTPATWFTESWVFGGSLVHFDESGLSPDTIWLVSLNGSTNLSTTSSVGFVVGNGTYTYTVGILVSNAYGVRYAPARPAGVIHVHGATIRVPVLFGEQFYLRTGVIPASSGFASPLNAWVASGGALNLLAAPIPGFIFVGWEGQGVGNYTGNADPLNLTLNAPLNETAEFAPFATFSVTFGETGLPAPTSWGVVLNGVPYATVSANLTVRVPNGSYSWSAPVVAGVAAGLRFAPSLPNGTFTVGGAPMRVQVPFTLSALVQVSVSPSGGGVAGPSSGWYTVGSTILLIEEAANGYSFTGWQGTGSGSFTGSDQGISLTVDGPISEVATFEAGATSSLWHSTIPVWFAAVLVALAAVAGMLVALLVLGRRRRGAPA
ncbi:MAG: hypothetical protein L3K07_07110 [Thermoplasmata archaeon]|nr:hypothetical protein [Thermoplasmata archaeon]